MLSARAGTAVVGDCTKANWTAMCTVVVREFSTQKNEKGDKEKLGDAAFGSDESPYMVSANTDLDMKQIKLPWLRLEQKAEIWALHKSDPQQWTIPALAQRFGARQERVKAVLYLQRLREETMRDAGVLEMSAQWTDMHRQWQDWQQLGEAAKVAKAAHADFAKQKKHKKWLTEADAGLPAIPEVPPEDKFFETLSKTFSMSLDEAKAIVLKVETHAVKLRFEQRRERKTQDMADEWAEDGANIAFRETAVATKGRKALDDYYPKLFGDFGLEKHKEYLRRRIAKETQAAVEEVGAVPLFLRDPDVSRANAPADASNAAGVGTTHLGRWKWAFRDLAKKDTQPTMVRTRRGAWRPANALEESTRSWVSNPTALDLKVFRERVQELIDVDGDHKASLQLRADKTARRKAQLATPAKK